MGKSHYELVPGQDCPETASYFNIWHLWNAGSPEENKRSICAFEWDMGERGLSGTRVSVGCVGPGLAGVAHRFTDLTPSAGCQAYGALQLGRGPSRVLQSQLQDYRTRP